MEASSGDSPIAATSEKFPDLEKKESDLEAPITTGGSGRKSSGSKETGHSILNSVNKSTFQIKKPTHRRSASPINWFPRKKADSYLKRKIKHLQEVGGMNLSLDETLGSANPHYTRIAREKIAAREAARKAMKARKAAMVEASWCRILQAARIQSKEAEEVLEKAKLHAAEAFEAARAMGVMMYDKPDCPRQPCEVVTSAAVGGRSTHKISASFETAFEVDKEVAAAVKKAFIWLANCPSSSNKEEFKDLLWKISQNPDSNETGEDLTDPQSEVELELVHKMLDRLKRLHEDELSSLAVVVATCGLNAALLEVESGKDHDLGPVNSLSVGFLGTSTRRFSNVQGFLEENLQKKEAVTEVPSLDKFLVKHVSRLQREVEEARKVKKSDSKLENERSRGSNVTIAECASDLGSVLVKHVSKLEREIQEAKKNIHKDNPRPEGGKCMESNDIEGVNAENQGAESNNVASESTGSCEDRKKHELLAGHRNAQAYSHGGILEDKENIVLDQVNKRLSRVERAKNEVLKTFSSINNNGGEEAQFAGLDKILVKPVCRLEKEKMQRLENVSNFKSQKCEKRQGNEAIPLESLDKILVKHVSRLEREKMAFRGNDDSITIKKREKESKEKGVVESLGEILVKHQSKLEKAKLAASEQLGDDFQNGKTRKEARERELLEAWGGLSLGNSIKPHLSRIERDKAAWRRAEEEQMHAMGV
ncbi:uncharacterized protein LOC109712307 [Ananas comosus]|uniref:Uncharacterized protein LOC109712307 n=1 Tax=Ananas comosus TaxID=4615 RepID=A0A6P5F5W6_ANACO|nr:uncharacterized protein LOC109712307 [Ananas comosus]XP_020091389.1 uncharacterized protein LOC109712307 [Ananas comosus]XP_020091390.1 uncharacterized protein LOC109712307 [Ananas comosus]